MAGRRKSKKIRFPMIANIHENDLKLQRWYPNRSYYPDSCFPRDHPLCQAVSKLDETAVWRAMELFRSHPKHQFIACHKSRPESSYLIDFDSLDFMQYIPVKSDLTLLGLGSSLNHLNALGFLELQLFRHMDGKNTIKVCIEASRLRGHSKTLEEKVRATIRHLWRTDLIYLRPKFLDRSSRIVSRFNEIPARGLRDSAYSWMVLRRSRALCCLGLGVVRTSKVGASGPAAGMRQMFLTIPLRSLSRVRKLWTWLPSSSVLESALCWAASERLAGATGSRVVLAWRSSSENRSGRQASSMCHWT